MRVGSIQHGLSAAAAQLSTAKVTRVALAWSVTDQLTPDSETERELACCDAGFVLKQAVPVGSLGDACLEFRARNRIAPIAAKAEAGGDVVRKLATRRVLLHDILHVLLDFDASWVGEFGVFSFVAAQNYCPQFDRAARRLGLFYTTAAPWLRDDLASAEYRGRRLGHSAPRLLSMPIEHEWYTSLLPLQVRLGLKRQRRLRPIVPAIAYEPPREVRAAGAQ